MLNHPLAVGTKVTTLVGETADNGEGKEVHAAPGTVGEITSADFYEKQGWTYGVHFGEVWVFIDQTDSIDDPSKYTVAA